MIGEFYCHIWALTHTAAFKLGRLLYILALFSSSRINLKHRFNFDQELPVGYRNRKSKMAKMLKIVSFIG